MIKGQNLKFLYNAMYNNFSPNKVIFKVQHITLKKGHFLGLSRAGKNLIVVSAVSGLGYK